MFNELKITSELLSLSPYEQFENPAHNLAERLVVLGHLSFNADVWAASPDRIKRYWKAYAENIEGSANTNRLSVWWQQMTEGMACKPLNDIKYLNEKNLLLDPTHLQPSTEESDVLEVFRRETGYLIDRTRVWVAARRESKKAMLPDVDIAIEGDK